MKRLKKFELIKDDSEGELPDGDYVVSSPEHVWTIRRRTDGVWYGVRSDGRAITKSMTLRWECHHRIEGDRLVPPTPKPRVWQRIEDVPEGVVVKDNTLDRLTVLGGEAIRVLSGGISIPDYPLPDWNNYAPFTATGDRVEIEFGECDD